MLSPESIEEIFIAFIGAGNAPSRKLFAALGKATETTDEDLRARYRALAKSVAGAPIDPFEE
ncbi:MAG: hypothetical protein JO055_15785 [Alphaproteobacteria bacterium]|nr:hypothetical protein [Alphaproteobacteria bacterium]